MGLTNENRSANITGSFVEVAAIDLDVGGDGCVGVGRAYLEGTVITIAAPPSSAGRPFLRWKVDGVLQPFGLRTIEVEITSDVDIEAIYRRSRRVDPDSPTEGDGDME